MSLKIYEINPVYIDYLLPFAPHLFHTATLVHKLKTNVSISPLTKRCNDFLLLEEKCKAFC